jgi:hypothetical protein
MADEPNRDREAAQASRNMERRHQDDIEAMAKKNAEVQREAQKVRRATDERKAAMRRKADLL